MTPTLIPDTAPFNDDQRAWLNGFFAGFLGIRSAMTANKSVDALSDSAVVSEFSASAAEALPWHDPAIAIDERMQLANGKPVEQRLMAAMAQLDCGSCGYLCKTYSLAIATGAENNLTLCTPGGQSTSRMVKLILKSEKDSGNGKVGSPSAIQAPTEVAVAVDRVPSTSGYTRARPFSSRLLESRPLNHIGSAKDTRHVALDLTGSGLKYEVGDALGVYPTNCRELVDQILNRLGWDGSERLVHQDLTVAQHSDLREYLLYKTCLKAPTDELLSLLLTHSQNASSQETLTQILNDGPALGFDVLDAIELAQSSGIPPDAFVLTLNPLQPRLYSIASSQRVVGEAVHLTVGKVAYERSDRQRKGVASTMLADRVAVKSEVRVFVQPNHGGFTVPQDQSASMIMVGPGTGIAPFIAFLQEREACKSPGKNWLFFGDQRRQLDFLYEQELQSWVASGHLSTLDLAFSRDLNAKVYVQDRMREQAKELWKWLEAGAHFYVCGDAARMATDVDRTLREIIATEGKLNADATKTYMTRLQQQQRYVRDVY